MVRSGKSKRKPFNSNVADYLLIIAIFLQLPPRAERHIQHMHMRFYRAEAGRIHHEHEFHMHGCSLLVVQVEASNFGAWFESLGGTEGGLFGYRALSLMERK